MDRVIVYPGEIPLDTHILLPSQSTMIALGYLAQACLGTNPVVDGLACTPTLPASMQVSIGPGSIATLATIDNSPYGTLSTDLDPLVKMGINPFGSTTFTLTSPGTSGQSIAYLIEAQLVESDGSPVSLPYYNAQTPNQPFTGPNNNQASQNTIRTQRVALQLKPGAPAAAGTQQTPAVDGGWVGLYVITVNFAQTTVTASSIAIYPGAPFINAKIPALAPLSSPNFSNTPTAPTAPAGTSSVQLATTAFVTGFGHAPFSQAFATTGSWIAPPGVTSVRSRIWGPGGGSGGTFGINSGSQGGGGGAYSEGVYAVTPGQSYTVTIGSGGTGGTGTNPPTAGTGGGTTSFGTFHSATGGAGGLAGNGTVASNVANGGTASGGNLINIPGQRSGATFLFLLPGSTTAIGISVGGASPNGGDGGHFGTTNVSVAGSAGIFPGGGSTGSAAQANGGNGAGGLCILEW